MQVCQYDLVQTHDIFRRSMQTVIGWCTCMPLWNIGYRNLLVIISNQIN